MSTEITPEYAMQVAATFLSAATALRDGEHARAVELLSASFEPDNDLVAQQTCGQFSTGAMIAGRCLRKACADPDDPAPFDGPAALEIVDGRSGLPAHPDDLPRVERMAIWAAAAGANLDVDGISAQLGVLLRFGGLDAVLEGVVMLVRITAACWDGGPLG